MANHDDSWDFANQVRRTARVGLTLGASALVIGLMMVEAGWSQGGWLLLGGLGLVVALPAVNVAVALLEEGRRREWRFVVAALTVLGILLYNVWKEFH
jgi:hypothetical protein